MLKKSLEFCHVFIFIDDPERAISTMARLGFQESYRRKHNGQGTENVCYCFNNMYLEFLWVTDEAELNSPKVRPLQFSKRSNWQINKTSPFGLAIRDNQEFPFDAHAYHAPFFPEGMILPYAKSSDDLHHPFLFLSPGSKRPDQWDVNSPLITQNKNGFSEISELSLQLTQDTQIHDDLINLEKRSILSLKKFKNKEGKNISILSLPSLTLNSL
jgi:hypothetical protein